MSYIVDVTDKPKWFLNAWYDAFKISPEPRKLARRAWAWLYPDYVYTWGGYAGPTTVTFPDEKTYTWFVLKWS